MKKWDVFICHASEDKESIVRPLAKSLKQKGLKVWFDESELTLGDSLRESIDRGLASSKFGVVILSPNFLSKKKKWTKKELNALFAREVRGSKVKVILPVLHNITQQSIVQRIPLLADKVSVSTNKGLNSVVNEIVRAIKPRKRISIKTHFTPKTDGLSKRRKKTHQKASEKDSKLNSTISLETTLSSLEKIHALRILGLNKEVKSEIMKIFPHVTNRADKKILNTLLKDNDISVELAKNKLSVDKAKTAWQKLYNELSHPSVVKASEKGLFPSWVLKSETLRVLYYLNKSRSITMDEFRKSSFHHINTLIELWEESGYNDLMSFYRRIGLLIDLSENSHAKRAIEEGLAFAPTYFPFYILMAELAVRELRYDEALEYLLKAKKLVEVGIETPNIEFMISYCHYFLGNFQESINIAKKGMEKWPYIVGFKNNYAFSTIRAWRRAKKKFWEDVPKACEVLEEFLKSIVEIGAFGIAHINYALMLYWAEREGKLSEALKIVEKHGRADLIESEEPVVKAFERSMDSFEKDLNHFNKVISSYFRKRAKDPKDIDLKAMILDELVWDVDNFISYRHSLDTWKRSFLFKERTIKESSWDSSHLVTLKRWMRGFLPMKKTLVRDGGGYFLKWNGKGVVINPGARFIDNFLRRGYAISEINAILVTSSYFTAYEELTSLLDVIDKAYNHRPSEEKVEIYLEAKVLQRFPDFLPQKSPSIASQQILNPNYKNSICDGVIEVETISVSPYENQPLSTITLLNLKEKRIKKRVIGVVCDYCSQEMLSSHMKDVDIILASVGSIEPRVLFQDKIPNEFKAVWMRLFDYDPLYKETFGLRVDDDFESLFEKINSSRTDFKTTSMKQYLGMEGLLQLADYLKSLKKIVILCDLPIELGEKRHSIATVLNEAYKIYAKSPCFLTEDIGLVVGLENLEVLCEFEYRMKSAWNIDEECLEGNATGPVKHFCPQHREDPLFSDFLLRDY
jgi:tetratricopeptide (TPR) repeat protein